MASEASSSTGGSAAERELERVHAARVLLDSPRFENDEAAQMSAFMDIFHPGHPATDELVRRTREHHRRR